MARSLFWLGFASFQVTVWADIILGVDFTSAQKGEAYAGAACMMIFSIGVQFLHGGKDTK
jgi:hypothetical protein